MLRDVDDGAAIFSAEGESLNEPKEDEDRGREESDLGKPGQDADRGRPAAHDRDR